MTVSVVVAARDSAATLPQCLEALRAQNHPHVEIIVVDDGSTDDTAAIAGAAGVRVLSTPPIGASAARNMGIDVARGEVVAFTDGDCVADVGWVRALVEGLCTTGATGVGGRQINVFPPGQQWLREGFEAFFRVASVVSDYTRGDERPREVSHNASCCSAYRVEALRAVGGFTPGLWPGEDVDLDLRLAAQGGRFSYVPGAVVHHHRPGTFAWFRRMMRRYGEAERRLVRLHGRARLVDHVPTVTAAWLALHLLLAWPAARPWLVGLDVALVVAGVAALAVTTPVRLWPTVVAFGVTAVWEWHVGWWTAARLGQPVPPPAGQGPAATYDRGATLGQAPAPTEAEQRPAATSDPGAYGSARSPRAGHHADIVEQERAHENAWYTRALRDRFFEREGFRRLVAWNVAAFRREVPLRRDMRVLSIGAGLGDYEIAIAPLVGHIVAVELSETAAEAARERLRAAALSNVEVIAGAVDTQPFEGERFDVVYAMGVFHHFLPDQRRQLLARVHGWLAPGGWLYVRDPNARGVLRRLLEGWFRRRSDVHAEQETSLDPYVLRDEAGRAGFREPRIDYIDVIGGPLPWLVRSESRTFWRVVFGFDRLWLAVPALRRAASQFALIARK